VDSKKFNKIYNEIYYECNVNPLFERVLRKTNSLKLERLCEMSRTSSIAVGTLCATLLYRRRLTDTNWQSEDSLKAIVDETIRKGCGTNENLVPLYSDQEKSTPNKFEAYLTNVINVVKNEMKVYLSSESTVSRMFAR
jgi:hypothetical protein